MKKITVSSNKIEFKNGTVTKDIFVKKSKKIFSYDQYIYLKKSNVNGNIVFESGKGHVVLSDGSKVAGTIIGGIIEK